MLKQLEKIAEKLREAKNRKEIYAKRDTKHSETMVIVEDSNIFNLRFALANMVEGIRGLKSKVNENICDCADLGHLCGYCIYSGGIPTEEQLQEILKEK